MREEWYTNFKQIANVNILTWIHKQCNSKEKV